MKSNIQIDTNPDLTAIVGSSIKLEENATEFQRCDLTIKSNIETNQAEKKFNKIRADMKNQKVFKFRLKKKNQCGFWWAWKRITCERYL